MGHLPELRMTAPGFSTRSEAVRAAREAFWCARTEMGLAVLRHREAGQILRDRRFRQGSFAWPETVGISGSFAAFWRRSVIALEGAPHKALRRVAQEALSAAYITSLQPAFTATAEALLSPLLDGPGFDFVEQFSEPFAGCAITALLGLPDAEAAQLALDASTLGKAMGLDAPRYEAEVNAACDRLMALAERLIDRATPEAGDFTSRALRAMAALGPVDRQALKDLVVISIFGGVDTTRAQLAFAVALFIEHPGQWAALRADPTLVPQAVEEVIRTRPTTTWASRCATEDLEFGGLKIAQGTLVHILVHASGTDPQADPGVAPWGGFDVTQRRKVHFGFGGGAHSCLGQLVARTDMACALRVLAERVGRFEWAGVPAYLPDSGNTSPASLPVRARAA